MSKLVSVIVPVYNAEQTLRKCVESIVCGRYANVEVILVDDQSQDGSWELCNRLSNDYPQVKCVRNPVNSGVSVTRNHGLDEATGEYICFVDSDDWVSCRFIETLVTEAELHPQELPVCGFRFINRVDHYEANYLMSESEPECHFLPINQTFKLTEGAWFQCVWNKIFCRDVISSHGLRFTPGKNMGEDTEFLLSYLEVCKQNGYRIINLPLYYYVRASAQSLMSQFGLDNFNDSLKIYQRILGVCNDQSAASDYEKAVKGLRGNFCYHIVHAKQLSKKEKLARIGQICGPSLAKKQYRQYMLILYKEKIAKLLFRFSALGSKFLGRVRSMKTKRLISAVKRSLPHAEVTIISQNCIGGVFYHDMNQQFLSPTVNLFLVAKDFIKFATDLHKYLSAPMQMRWDETYPIGQLGDIEIHFMHYSTCQEAKQSWERRCARINWDKIVIFSTDRDNFSSVEFEQWQKLPYPKVLFTAQKEFSDHEDSVYFEEFSNDGCVPDLIPDRKFYRNGTAARAIQRCIDGN